MSTPAPEASAEPKNAPTPSDRPAAPKFTPPESQEELDRVINKAVGKYHARYADYDEIKAKADKHDALEDELSSEADKKAREARKAAEAEKDAEYQPRMAETAFRIAIGDRKTADEVEEFIGDLNLTRFLKDGQVDTAKVLSRVEQFIGKASTAPTRVGPSSSGQGNRPANGNAGDPARAWLAKQGIKVD